MYPICTLFSIKDVGFRIRVQRELRKQFVAACRRQDKPAAQVLREFMRAFVDENTDPNDEAGSVVKEPSQE